MDELIKLRTGFQVQRRVILALILREASTRHGKTQIGYLWEILLPLALISLKVSIFSFIGRAPPLGDNLFLFFSTGLLPFLFWQKVTRQVQNGLTANHALLSYPQVLPVDVFLARGILELSTTIIVATLIFIGLDMAGIEFYVRSFPELMALMLLYFTFSIGLGMINASIIRHYPSFDNMFSMITTPMFFLSGIFYIAESLPPLVREWLLWLPMLQYSEWFRSIFYPTFDSSYVDIHYLFFTSLVTVFLGLALNKIMSERTE